MEANELRIGDFVNYGKKVSSVLEIRNEGVIVQILGFDNNQLIDLGERNIEPIPLTEEWLLKFGWIWNEECNSYEKYPNGDARMNMAYRELNGSYTMFNYVIKATICERIWYVHQLQNLYFALTGEELTIKELV